MKFPRSLLGCLFLGLGFSSPLPGEPFTITVANYQVTPTEPEAEMVPLLEARFGIRLKILNLENQRFHELLNLRIAAGEVPDFLYLRQATSLANYARLGVLTPLSESLVSTQAPHLYRLLQEQAPGYLEMGKVDGVLYGIPVVSPTNRFHVPLVYRRDWMDRVGIGKTPETLAEFEELLYRFARNDPDGNGKKDTYGMSKDGLTAVFGAFGLVPWDEKTDYWIVEGGRLVNSSVSPRAKAALALLAKWYREGLIDPEFVTGENKGGYWALSHSFLSGRIGFTTHGNYYHWIAEGAFPGAEPLANGKALETSQPSGRLAFGNPLTGPEGRKGIKQYNRLMNFVTVGRPASLVPGKVEKVLSIFDASAGPSLKERLSLVYGIEGRHWRLAGDGSETVEILPPFNREEGYRSRIGLQLDLEVPLPPKGPREQWAYRLGLDRFGIESAIQVGLPLMMKNDAALKRLRNEAYLAIVTGAKPVSWFDEFVRRYRLAGGDEVQAEANAYWRAR